jgi:tripartite-type tricarboxylate transporter receptor subunit TctC
MALSDHGWRGRGSGQSRTTACSRRPTAQAPASLRLPGAALELRKMEGYTHSSETHSAICMSRFHLDPRTVTDQTRIDTKVPDTFTSLRRFHVRQIVIALLMLIAWTATAQQYPSRAVRVVVHCPPGCGPDITSRLLAQHLGDALGQPFVVENRTGANGNIAGDIVAKSPPDGHTLALCVDSQIAINPHVYVKMPFDPLKDLAAIATVASNEFTLVVHPSLPVKSFEEFIAFARKARPALTYSSAGNGSLFHLTMEMLRSRAGIELIHVPFKGGGPATTAIITGEVSVAFAGASAAAYPP